VLGLALLVVAGAFLGAGYYLIDFSVRQFLGG
jgi:hypothetical protein